MEKKEKSKKPLIIVAVVLVVLGVLILFGVAIGSHVKNDGKTKEEAISGMITLDINPTIEIEINDGKANRVNPKGEDAWELVDRDSMEGKPLQEVFEAIIEKAKEKDFIQSGELFIILGVEDNNISKTVEEVFKAACVAKDVHVKLIVPEITEEAKHEAEGYGVTPAKAAYILELLKENEKLNFDDLRTKSAAELIEMEDTGMYCESGFTLKSGKCEKVIKEEKPEEGKTCPEGYELIKDKCYKTSEPKKEPYCKNGLTLKDNKCVGTQKTNATPKCKTGQYNSKSGKCEVSVATNDGNKKCSGQNQDPKDQMMSNGKCSRGKPANDDNTCYGNDKFIADNSGGPNAGWCYNPSGDYTPDITCPSGQTAKDGKCYKVTTSDPTYSCSSGKLEGTKCIGDVSKNPGQKNSCDSGLSLYQDRVCVDYNDSKDSVVGYICNKDARLEGEHCVYYETVDALSK